MPPKRAPERRAGLALPPFHSWAPERQQLRQVDEEDTSSPGPAGSPTGASPWLVPMGRRLGKMVNTPRRKSAGVGREVKRLLCSPSQTRCVAPGGPRGSRPAVQAGVGSGSARTAPGARAGTGTETPGTAGTHSGDGMARAALHPARPSAPPNVQNNDRFVSGGKIYGGAQRESTGRAESAVFACIMAMFAAHSPTPPHLPLPASPAIN